MPPSADATPSSQSPLHGASGLSMGGGWNKPAVRQVAAAMEAAGEGTAFLMARRLDKARATGRLKHIEHSAATVARRLAEAGWGALTEPPRGGLPSWTVLVPNRDVALSASMTPDALSATMIPHALSATMIKISACLPAGLMPRLTRPWRAHAYARAALTTEAAHG